MNFNDLSIECGCLNEKFFKTRKYVECTFSFGNCGCGACFCFQMKYINRFVCVSRKYEHCNCKFHLQI